MRTTTRETHDLEALQSRLADMKWRMVGFDRYTDKFQLFDRWNVPRGEFSESEAEDYLEGIAAWLEEEGR